MRRAMPLGLALLLAVALGGCAGAPVEPGENPMDWGPGAAGMDPEERAFMSECTKYASWSYCKTELLGGPKP